MEDLQGQVAAFLEQLPSKEGRQVLDRLLRRLAAGEPLSARKVSDRVDESCEFLAELLQFCQGGPEMLAQVLQSAAGGDPGTQEEQQLLGRFLASRRRFRLAEQVRIFGAWEEHFAPDKSRYFYNNETQITQWPVPEGWPQEAEAAVEVPADKSSIVLCDT
ncbi:unnamed protein product [Polarella glacialis]|uniref:WW domain-containing protein n=1 Tax=Polarella glacialis TaxID=89957 RepID=A0A813IXD9_POLGL|nr:unnamed protein product [Polarella glacialis]